MTESNFFTIIDSTAPSFLIAASTTTHSTNAVIESGVRSWNKGAANLAIQLCGLGLSDAYYALGDASITCSTAGLHAFLPGGLGPLTLRLGNKARSSYLSVVCTTAADTFSVTLGYVG